MFCLIKCWQLSESPCNLPLILNSIAIKSPRTTNKRIYTHAKIYPFNLLVSRCHFPFSRIWLPSISSAVCQTHRRRIFIDNFYRSNEREETIFLLTHLHHFNSLLFSFSFLALFTRNSNTLISLNSTFVQNGGVQSPFYPSHRCDIF